MPGSGWAKGEFQVELREHGEGPSGRDEAVFLVRLNSGLQFAPVAATASGGELSRIALALAAVLPRHPSTRGRGPAPLRRSYSTRSTPASAARPHTTSPRRCSGWRCSAQVITITHLPQIASVADAHFRVEKVSGDPTRTHIDRLDDTERRDELERMLGGQEFLAALSGGRAE